MFIRLQAVDTVGHIGLRERRAVVLQKTCYNQGRIQDFKLKGREVRGSGGQSFPEAEAFLLIRAYFFVSQRN